MVYMKQLLLVILSLAMASTTAFVNSHTPSRLFIQKNALSTTPQMARTYTILDPVALNQKNEKKTSVPGTTRHARPITKKGIHATKRFSDFVKLGIVSSAHIGIASYISVLIKYMYPQKFYATAFVLPFGVLMSLFTGGELFTKQTALLAVKARSRK